MARPITTGKDVIEVFSRFVNNYNCEEEQFVDAFSCEHRTLQQAMTGVMLKTIEHMASDNYHTDGRNEASKKIATKIVKAVKAEIYQELLDEGWKPEKAKKFVDEGTISHLPFI